jgi:predicted RNase H-like HicB family nuclease
MHYVGILDGKGDVWGVRIPDLRGAYGGGANPEEAIESVIEGAREWVASVSGRGYPIPAPSPLADIVASGQVESGEALVMIPVSLDAPAS